MGSAGLGTGARQAHAAERLRADHRADLVAVDVDVAAPGGGTEPLDAALDAGVQREREAVTAGIDLGYQSCEFVLLKNSHMQQRTEHLARQIAESVEAKGGRRREAAVRAHRGQGHLK